MSRRRTVIVIPLGAIVLLLIGGYLLVNGHGFWGGLLLLFGVCALP